MTHRTSILHVVVTGVLFGCAAKPAAPVASSEPAAAEPAPPSPVQTESLSAAESPAEDVEFGGYYLPDESEKDAIIRFSGDAAPISGVVLDKDGKPWASVQIVVSGEVIEAVLGFTDENGAFEVHGLPRSEVSISASAEQAGSDATVVLPGDKPQSITLVPACEDYQKDSCNPRARPSTK